MKHSNRAISLIIGLLSWAHFALPYSAQRPGVRDLPTITCFWLNDEITQWKLAGKHLETWSLFERYDPVFLDKHRLPADAIRHKYNPKNQTYGHEVSKDLEELVEELENHKGIHKPTQFKKFSILKAKDFSFTKKCGLLVLQYIDENKPFVIKLYRETPASFVKPFNKGIEPIFFHYMGNGINRYLLGFTRIKNLKAIEAIINKSAEWRDKISLPRKWYWTPQNNKLFTVRGENLDHPRSLRIVNYPSVYAIVCDKMEIAKTFSLQDSKECELVMRLSKLFGNRIDPHVVNFGLEKGSNKITIIDTEHFASIVGLKQPVEFKSHFRWYCKLAGKCLKDMFLTGPETRRITTQKCDTHILVV